MYSNFKGYSIDFNDLQTKKNFSPFKAYGRSKLAIKLFTIEFVRRQEG